MTDLQLPVDIERIREMLPHRYPFLLVDRVVEFESGKRIKAWKNVSINEPFFNGHFPAHAVMPGVLVIEALAQAGGLLSHMTRGGDRLELEVELKRVIRNMVQYVGTATVDGKIAACAEILCAEVDA